MSDEIKNDNADTPIDKPTVHTGITDVKIVEQIKKAFLEYSMSVIVARALPDVRDGLKPVQRRILFGMSELGITPTTAHKKSARIVGEVMGKFHPHGDSSIYDAMVRMAQDFSYREPLVDGHGNFGSLDGDPPAAMRYTEARLTKVATEMLADLDKDTVDFMPNFDETLKEPTVLPSRIPNLLVNGAQGIAVGMATNIPPHNLSDVIDATVAYIDDNNISIRDLTRIIKGPDFPTGAIITGNSEIEQIYQTGKGRIVIRAKTEILEKSNGRSAIEVTEIPYTVNKAEMIKNIAEHVKDGRITGISDIRDESDIEGLRIMIECKKDANPNVILNKLFTYTELQTNFSVNMLALVGGEPKILNLRDMIYNYVLHRKDVVVRRSRFELNKAEARAHIVEGLLKAHDIIDEIIKTIRSSKTTQDAKQSLIELYGFSEKQAQAILEMRLQQLTNLEINKLEAELEALRDTISYLKAVLESDKMQYDIIKEELLSVKQKYGEPRKTQIDYNMEEINYEDLIQEKDIVISITNRGYIKRTPLSIYRAQNRGGKGVKGATAREDDFIRDIIATTTHCKLLFFTNFGKVYTATGYDIPEAGKNAKGTAVINIINLQPEERVQHIIPLDKEFDKKYIVFATKLGYVKRMEFDEIKKIRSSGLIAITLEEGDELISVAFTNGDNDVIAVTKAGKGIRFSEDDMRPMGRSARGIRGINFNEGDELVDLAAIEDGKDLLFVSENGFGKRSVSDLYRRQSRGGKGMIAMTVNDKTGGIVAMRSIDDNDDIIVMNSSGIMIRTALSQLAQLGRGTRGVTLMRLDEDEKVVSAAIVPHDDEAVEANENVVAEAPELEDDVQPNEDASDNNE